MIPELQATRKKWLYSFLLVALVLLGLDRSAAYLYRPAHDAKEVVIYTTEKCPYCKKLRVYLDSHKIRYVDRNIYKSVSGMMGFWTLRGRGVPVSVIGPEVIHGLDMPKIRKSLNVLGYKTANLP